VVDAGTKTEDYKTEDRRLEEEETWEAGEWDAGGMRSLISCLPVFCLD
jgi:hypothetical protein